MEAKPERLQKILAAAGLASRRKAEELIAAGVVSVNGHIITEPGTKADPRIDEIRVDGKLLGSPERHVYLAVYKPKGHMTTVSDPEGRPTVMDLLKGVEERVFPVGRLDYMSEGLLLLTNDGDLMAELTKAGSHVAKTYMVKVSGKPSDDAIDKLRNGIMLPPEPGLTGTRGKKQPGVERRSFAVLTQPAIIQLAVDQENPWFEVTLTEGRNRQLRRMFEQVGHHIEKIKRVRYASLTLDLEPGEFRHLTPKEVNQLRKSLETPFKPRPIKPKSISAKRRDDRPERAPRVDTARFVKGRRGKPSADAPAPSAIRASAARDSASAPRSTVRTTTSTEAPRRPFTPREDRPERSPRGPEFAASPRRESAAGFAAKRPYVRKPVAGPSARPSGDFEERPKRAYTRKPADSAGRKAASYARKSGGDFSKRDGGYAAKRAPARREPDFADAPPKAPAKSVGGFGFSKYNKPKFVKPSKHRDLGSDKTAPVGERSLFGAPKPAAPSRPYSKDRSPSTDRGFAKKTGAYSGTGTRPYSKGPGKPPARSAGDYKPRPAGDYKPRPSGTDFKRGGEARPPNRAGAYGKSFSSDRDRPRTSPGGTRGKSSSGASYGAKRPSTGYGAKRPGTGFSAKRTGSAPPRGARPSAPPRRRPEE
jgi:23S rRNA pseudouridine2605 synthase